MSSFKIFNEDEMPDKSQFFSSLKDSEINEKENDEYHDLYLKQMYCC